MEIIRHSGMPMMLDKTVIEGFQNHIAERRAGKTHKVIKIT